MIFTCEVLSRPIFTIGALTSLPLSERNHDRRRDFSVSSSTFPVKMVNAIKGLFVTCDIPMAQFIIHTNNALPASQKFIIHVLDSTHLFVQPHAAAMIRTAITEFRDKNSYDKPAAA